MDAEYIVVGAGAAGCAFATRLSQLTSARVLLLEAGSRVRDPRAHVPLAFGRALGRPRLTSSYPTSTVGGEEQDLWLRGRGLGGSTAVNGHLHLRPSGSDRQALAAAVDDPWWSAEAQRSGLAAVEADVGDAWRPGDGIPVHRPDVSGPVVDAVMSVANADGVAVTTSAGGPGDEDVADDEHLRVAPVSTYRGRRVGAARAFLPAAGSNLHVLTEVEVDQLLFDGDRVVGVRTLAGRGRSRGVVAVHHAAAEVVLCAGALATPLLLQRSGIGPERVLRAAGVPIRVVSPSVGARLRESRTVTLTLRLREGLGRTTALATGRGRAAAMARYTVTRAGPLARAPFELVGSLAVVGDRPDAHVLFGTLCPDAGGLDPAGRAGAILQGYVARPTSVASLAITGPALDHPPDILVDHLSTDHDRAISVGLLRRMRSWAGAAPFREMVVDELLPGAQVTEDAAVVSHVRQHGAGIYHAVGSCGAGTDAEDVVDPHLRVRGVRGLRVADASVFPVTPAAGTAAATSALAWRAAGLLCRTGSA